MKKLRRYISLVLLLLITVPVIDRACDELGHLHEIHCDDSSLHYCQTEHDCPVCDYVFSSTASLPHVEFALQVRISSQVSFPPALPSLAIAIEHGLPLQRGPPSC